MRILYFTDTYLPQINGVTNTLDKLGRYLDGNNIQYRFFAPYYAGGLRSLNEGRIQRFRSISLPAYPECRLSVPAYSNICRLADKFRPEVVHLMTPAGMGLAGLKYARDRGMPVAASYTTNFDAYLKYYKLEFMNTLLWSFFRWFHNSCRINFCPSQDTAKILKTRGIENVRIWSRGIDTETFSPARRSADMRKRLGAGERITFLYVGRLAPEKDLDILLESIRQVNRCFSDTTRFIIAGDGPYASWLRKSSPENVLFTGYLRGKELSSLYASCDVFLFPSSTETFGNVVLEAMASGLPVIAANSGGVKDSVIDGYNGFLCEARNVEDFTRSILKFIKDRTLIQKMSIAARQCTLKKSWNSIFDQLISDYRMLIEQLYTNTNPPVKAG